MPIIDVGGRQIEVGEEFRNLSPEQKNAVVLELYQRMQAGAPKQDVRTVGPKVMEDAPPQPEPQQQGFAGRMLDKFGTQVRGAQAQIFNNWDDEITAGAMAPFQAGWDAVTGRGFDIGRAYSERQQRLNEDKQANFKRNPYDALLGRVVGGVGQAYLGGKAIEMAGKSVPAVAQAARSWGNFVNKRPIVGGMVEGAVQGAVSGAGDAKPGERMSGAGWGAFAGGAAGAAAGAVGSLVGRMTGKTPKTFEEVKDAKNALYQSAEANNVFIDNNLLKGITNKIKADNVVKLKYNSMGGEARDLINYLDEMLDQPNLTLKKVMELRSDIVEAQERAFRAGGTNSGIIRSIKESFDEAIDNIPDSAVTAARGVNKTFAVDLWKQARAANVVTKKQEIIDQIWNDAGTYRTGFENGLVLQFEKLIRSKKFKRFSPAEQEAIRRAAATRDFSAIPRAFAWLDPSKTFGLLTTVIGSQTSLPVGAAMGTIGAAATPIANAVRRGRANDVSRVIQGIPLPRAPQYIRGAPGVAGSIAGGWAGRSK